MATSGKSKAKKGKGQANRLSSQHLDSGGVVGIFGEDAQIHDADIRKVSDLLLKHLEDKFPDYSFRKRTSIKKSEIHDQMSKVDSRLGKALFVPTAYLQPDGGITEVLDKNDNWRIILVGESKHQGNDVNNINNGERTAKMESKGQYIMPAGNAIERVHKNIQELKNLMLTESHFPYVVFLQGSNFAIQEVTPVWPDGTKVPIRPDDSMVNRIDRVTASNYGMAINKNYCKNMIVSHPEGKMILQTTSIFAQCDLFSPKQMFDICCDIAETSLQVLSNDLK